MIVLPLNDLEQSSDTIQPGLFHPTDQLASLTLTYKESKERGHIKIWTDDLEKNKLHQAETNLGMVRTDSGQMGAQESLTSHTADLSLNYPFCFSLRGVQEPGYKLQSGAVSRHRQPAPNPKLQSVNKTNLYKRNIELVEKV